MCVNGKGLEIGEDEDEAEDDGSVKFIKNEKRAELNLKLSLV